MPKISGAIAPQAERVRAPRMPIVSLRVRLALWWGGLTGLVVLVVGLLFYAAESLTLYNDVDRELRATAERAMVARPAMGPQRPMVLAATEWVGIAVWVHAADGTVLATTPNATLAPSIDPEAFLVRTERSLPAYDWIVRVAPPYATVDAGNGRFGVHHGPDGNRWRVYVLPGESGGGGAARGEAVRPPAAGYVTAVAPLRDIDTATATTRRLVPVLAGVGGATMLLAGLLLARRALRPVAALTETAAAIARSEALDRRVAVGNAQDELGQMATTFNAMLDSLERAYRAQQRFVSDASHEIRTPLTSVLANLHLLERRPEMATDERQEAVREAARETRRLVRLVTHLLALARADAGVAPVRTRVALDRVVRDAFDEVRRVSGGRAMAVEALAEATVEGDADQIKQLVVILLDNAVKYTPEGGEVRVGLERRDGVAEVWVRDNGIGIGPEELPHVYERFYRGEAARARDPGGSGLGLSIGRWIAAQHGGELTLASARGAGTRAALRLRLAGVGTSSAGATGGLSNGSGRTQAGLSKAR